MGALNAGDIDALVALYEPRASMSAEAGEFVERADAIREVLKRTPVFYSTPSSHNQHPQPVFMVEFNS